MQLYHHQPHISAAAGSTTTHGFPSMLPETKHGKKRGSYNCGRCGLPKKGHLCHVKSTENNDSHAGNISTARTTVDVTSTPTDSSVSAFTNDSMPSSLSAIRQSTKKLPVIVKKALNLHRALSFDDLDEPTTTSGRHKIDPDEDDDLGVSFEGLDPDLAPGVLPPICLWEVLRRLPPVGLLSAARVCKGWRETARRLWKAADELRFRVPAKAQVGFVGSLLQKCSGLVRLSIRMESDVDATMLACIAFSCPNLEFVEITTSESAVNRINGDELGRFVADRRFLKSFKMEGCSNLGGFVLCSSSLSTLWLSHLNSISKMAFNCPQLTEISLEFSHQENDCTDLTTIIDSLGRSCPRLQNMHIASVRLSHAAVLALTDAQLRDLRMLSLVLGTGITDASVTAIASSFPNLELLDLSGSSISDSGIGIICSVFPETLSRLLLALCPNITSSGIQFAVAQLPLLELMDCGMTICNPYSHEPVSDENSCCETQRVPNANLHLMNQKLIIKHSHLKKLSLWGCSGLHGLYLNCPNLNDLNLNACKNLHPDRLLLQCPGLESVHAMGCHDMLVGAIRSQVCNTFHSMEDLSPRKRLPDGSKRIRAQHFLDIESSDDDKKRRRIGKPPCNVLVK